MDIKIDKEYAKLVPPLTDKEYEGLKLSIEVDGQHHCITINEDGYILDGHHRFRACQELEREPRYEVLRFSSKLKEIEFVRDSNLRRRHLNDFQRIIVVNNSKKLKERYGEAAKARQLSGLKKGDKLPLGQNCPNGETGRTSDKLAVIAQVRPTLYKYGVKIIEQGSEPVIKKLLDGKTTISKEYQKIQVEQIKKQLSSETPLINLPENCELIQGDFMEVGRQIPDNSIDLIITDPPYRGEDLPLFEKFGKFANRVLKEGGSLVLFAGQYDLLAKVNIIEKSGLKYRWQICVKHTGLQAKMRGFGTLINVAWKPLIWFIKGNNGRTNTPTWIVDFVESEPPKKIMHEWEQSTIESEHVIKGLTVENQIVLDPFMGYATNGIAALKLNRKFIGIEIDPIHYSNAQRRLSMLELGVYQK
jgi:DNA methylase/ParB/Sulfiredoxin domain